MGYLLIAPFYIISCGPTPRNIRHSALAAAAQVVCLALWCRYVGACSDAHMRCVYNMKFVTGLKMRTFPMPTCAC